MCAHGKGIKTEMYIRPTLRVHHSARGGVQYMEPTSGRVADIIAKMRAPDPLMWERKFTPISNLTEYLRLLEFDGTPKEELDIIEAKHKSVTKPPRIVNSTPKCAYVHRVEKEQVYITTRIKGSKVKVSIVNPYEKLFQHIRKCEPVPIESFVQFHALNGAPEKFLLDMMKRHDKLLETREADQEKLDKIFDKYFSKPKKPLKAVKKLPPVFE